MASVSRGSSMRGGRGRRSMSEINVVPYIDVMLVLLVIFMVTAPLVTPGTVDVPTVGKSSLAPTSYIQIELKLDGSMNVKVVGGSTPSTQNVGSVDAILPIVEKEQSRDTGNPAPVIIAADKTIQYDKVMQVMSKLQSAGVKRVGLSVNQARRRNDRAMVIAIEATRQYTVPRSGRSGPAMLLAILMHVLLALFLFFGLNWQSHAPEVIQAEVWSALPQLSAPAQNVPPPPPMEVERPKPVDVVPPPPPPVQPDIAIKEPVKKPPEKVAPPPPPPPPPPLQPKIEPKVVKVPPPPAAKPAVPSDLALLQAQAQAGPPSTGKAAQTSGPKGSPGYGQKIAGLIRQNIHFNPVGNPAVDLTIQILPGGVVGDVRVTQSSGNSSYDDAVVRGVHDSSPLPKDTDGTVPNPLYLHYQYSPT